MCRLCRIDTKGIVKLNTPKWLEELTQIINTLYWWFKSFISDCQITWSSRPTYFFNIEEKVKMLDDLSVLIPDILKGLNSRVDLFLVEWFNYIKNVVFAATSSEAVVLDNEERQSIKSAKSALKQIKDICEHIAGAF